ncbi:PAS domain-containing protein, partial [Pseudomonas viridiflava]
AERDRLNELLQIFTAAVPGVVYAKDLEGRMLVANRGTAELVGKPPEFFIGKTDLEFLDDEQQARVLMETDQRIMQSNVSEQIEEKVNLADGSAAIWLSTKAPL